MNIEKRVQIKCLTCLSVGRKMYSLQIYQDIFESIMSAVISVDMKSNSYKICWECFSLLRNVRRFQQKAFRARKLLENKHSNKTSLSSLCSKTLNETTKDSFCINKPQLDTKITKIKVETEVIENKSDHETDNFLEEISVGSPKTKINNHGKKTQSKWAQKHSLQKRKPKFKIIYNTNSISFNFRRLLLEKVEMHKSVCVKYDTNSSRENKSKCSKTDTEDCFKKNKVACKLKVKHYICDVCDARTRTKQSLINHLSEHYYKYECNWCKFNSHKKDELKNHLDKHKKLIKCLKCRFMCGSSQEFSVHYKDWHENYTCDYCGVTFKMRYCIKDHIRKRHSTYKCETCSKEFKRYNALWLHNKICHSTVQTKTYCNVCDKHFVDIYRYKWHLSNSVQHKPRKKVKVPCPDCDKVFTKNIYMRDHYNLVHLKVFNYRCEDCDKNFIRNADLSKHRRRVHEGILPPKDKICHFCGRGFTTNKILGNHLRTHASENTATQQL